MPETKERITIAPYDRRWPILFEEEKAHILKVLNGLVLAIEHVGSTAVPGLGAKPIVDIMVAVPDIVQAETASWPLETLGYEARGYCGIPGRLFFRKGTPRSHHVHMVEPTSDFWDLHLLFRDFLRVRPDVAREYEELKRLLAARYGDDRAAYTEAKTSFIESVLTRARGWRARAGR